MLLEGFEPELSHSYLRYGDTITLVPARSEDSIVSFAGTKDGKPLVARIAGNVAVPPNLRDCSYRLVPKNQYQEDKAVQKLYNQGSWDGGKGLAMPTLPEQGDGGDGGVVDPADLASEFAQQNRVTNTDKLRDFFAALISRREEMEGNAAEFKRQEGHVIRYGDSLQLLHETSSTYITVTKGQAQEKGCKAVSQLENGNDLSIFVAAPAFKNFVNGQPVSSGDLMVLMTRKKIDGREYFLHVSELKQGMAMTAQEVRRRLLSTSEYIIGGEEINATIGSNRPTFFRPLLFSRYENKTEFESLLKGEDVVSFYHKEADSYLDYNPDQADLPHFRQSLRVSDKSRKKSSWMWKIERATLHDAGAKVECSEGVQYRIKHVVSSMYLVQRGGDLEMTAEYNDAGTLFSFKSFSKGLLADSHVMKGQLLYIKSSSGAWMGHDAEGAEGTVGDQDAGAAPPEEAGTATKKKREKGIRMSDVPTPSESDALLVMGLRPAALKCVDRIRRAMFLLADYIRSLEALPEVDIWDISLKKTEGVRAPLELSQAAQNVLRVVAGSCGYVVSSLTEMCVVISHDDDPDPITRVGSPNKLTQKLLRELGGIGQVMKMINLPFTKGISVTWVGDPRFAEIAHLSRIAYSLMRLCVRQNERNALELYKHIDVMRSHLGNAVGCSPALKELFADKRGLLQRVKEDLIAQMVGLLRQGKDARFIDFLQTVCRCDGQPVPQNQNLVCQQLLEKNPDLLPRLRVEKGGERGGQTRVGIWLPGTTDEHGKEFWIDVAKFRAMAMRGERNQDLCSHIMESSWSDLDGQQRVVRYFVRCLELFSSLVLGRYQVALKAILTSSDFDFSYATMMSVIKETSMPHLIRARYLDLMLRLYVDRDPQTSKPQILYTRRWREVVAEESELLAAESSKPEVYLAPVCTTGFHNDLIPWLLEDLPSMAGAVDVAGNPGVTAQATVGQLEYVAAQLEILDLLVDFGMIVDRRDSTDPDFSGIINLYRSVFNMLDVRRTKRGSKSKTREQNLIMRVRKVGLGLISRILNLRTNYRISLALEAYENIFEKMEADGATHQKAGLLGMKSFGSMSSINTNSLTMAESYFKGYEPMFSDLVERLFSKPVVSPAEIGSDQVFSSGNAGAKDETLEMLLGLACLGRKGIQGAVFETFLMHETQPSLILNELNQTQVLVFPAACKVFEEVGYVLKRMTALKKHLAVDQQEALEEASMLMERMKAYVTESESNDAFIVRKNQTIMLNRELDEAILNVLHLNLARDTSRREAGELEADKAVNTARRELFQKCYDLLTAMINGMDRGQEKLFPMIGFFSDHVGIELLNVADTIATILRDNVKLCQQVKEDFVEQMVDAICIWGRKPRWLNFFAVLLETNGVPFKRNQDLILNMLLRKQDRVIDLSCDYSTANPRLSPSDARCGKTRLDLILAEDHRETPVRSLLLYHVSTLDILSMCCAGKNPGCKSKLFGIAQVSTMVDNILDIDLKPDGTREAGADSDTLSLVRAAWANLMFNVYLTSMDSAAVTQLLSEKRMWQSSREGVEISEEGGNGDGINAATIPIDTSNSLMHHFALCLEGLAERLGGVEGPMSSVKRLKGVADAKGKDLHSHVEYGSVITRVLKSYFEKEDLWGPNNRQETKALSVTMVSALGRVADEYRRLEVYEQNQECWQALETMHQAGFEISGDSQPMEEPDEVEPSLPGKEQTFSSGWALFKARICNFLDIKVPRSSKLKEEDVWRLAMQLGDQATFCNGDLAIMKQLMVFCCSREATAQQQLVALTIARAILYIWPEHKMEDKERELQFKLMLDNKTPGDMAIKGGDKVLADLQVKLAKKGAVDLIIHCMESSNKDVLLAALRLAVTILDGGNRKVQDMFADELQHPGNQGFFQSVRSTFETCIEEIKEAKRRKKQEAARKNSKRKSKGAKSGSLGGGANRRKSSVGGAEEKVELDPHTYATEAIKMIRRLCTGQHRALQDVLRVQRLNRETIDIYQEVYKYLTMLEPMIKRAIEGGNETVVEGSIRAFLMLTDAMQGPNYDNQQSLSKTGIFDLADRIFATMHYSVPERDSLLIIPKGIPKVKFALNTVAPESLTDEELVAKQNHDKCRLKTAVTGCLKAFLEGVVTDAIPRQMLMVSQWGQMVSQMARCQDLHHNREQEELGVLLKSELKSEGLGYLALMRMVQSFDSGKIIDRALSNQKKVVSRYNDLLGYVEISRNGRLERIFFELPDACVPGAPLDKPFAEMFDTEREDADKKNMEWVEHMCRLVGKERLHANIRRSYLAFTVNYWDNLCSLTFWWGLLLHSVLVIGGYMVPSQAAEFQAQVEFGGDYDGGDFDPAMQFAVQPYTNDIARVMGIVYLALCAVRAFSFIWAEAPIIAMAAAMSVETGDEHDDNAAAAEGEEGEEVDIDEDEALLITGSAVVKAAASKQMVQKDDDGIDNLGEILALEAQRQVMLTHAYVRGLATSPAVLYESLFILSGILTVVLDQPLFSVFSLMELCFWSGSRTVIDAIRFNISKMAQTMLLGLLTTYIWMIVGMVVLRNQHEDEMCNNMFQCFISYIYLGIRGDGVKDVLKEIDFPRNVVEAFVGEDLFIVVMIWDILYFLLFILILVAIITGIVIDAFGGMREEKEAAESDLKANCFVCNFARFPLDQSVGFDYHVKSEHNPRWYLFFLMYLRERPESLMSGVERYVFERVWPDKEYKWLPREQTFSMTSAEDDEGDKSTEEIKEHVKSVEEKVDSLSASMARIEQILLGGNTSPLGTRT